VLPLFYRLCDIYQFQIIQCYHSAHNIFINPFTTDLVAATRRELGLIAQNTYRNSMMHWLMNMNELSGS